MLIDICRDCADKILKITASGCQGYNEYKVRNKDNKWQELKEWVKENKYKQLDDRYIEELVDVVDVNSLLDKMQELEVEDE